MSSEAKTTHWSLMTCPVGIRTGMTTLLTLAIARTWVSGSMAAYRSITGRVNRHQISRRCLLLFFFRSGFDSFTHDVVARWEGLGPVLRPVEEVDDPTTG